MMYMSLTILFMSILERIQQDLKEAMKAKDSTHLATVRSILAAFKNAQVAGTGEPTESDYMALVKKQAKQRKESITQFEAAGREDLASKEREELQIIEAYLPTLLSAEEITHIITQRKAELGIQERSDMGKLMGALMKELKDTADGGLVKQLTEASFA